VILFTDIVSIK